MTEIETLRKEVNELRERVAILEYKYRLPVSSTRPPPDPYAPPFVVTCHTGGVPL